MKKLLFLPAVFILLSAVPSPAQTPADAEAMVKKAVAFAKANGKDKLVTETNATPSQFRKGEIYVFVLDGNGIVLGHAGNNKLVGKDLSQAKDPDGVQYVAELVKVGKSKGKGWVDYKFVNPETKAIQAKTSYVEKFEDVFIGAGAYKK